MQLGSEVGLTATAIMESTTTSAAMQINSPVDLPPPSAPREAGSNTGDPDVMNCLLALTQLLASQN